MRAVWDGNAHQLQNYDFSVIEVQERRVLYGMLYPVILARSHRVKIQFSLQATRSCSASGTSQCLLWVFHLTTQRKREIREAATYNVWKKGLFSSSPFVLCFI